MRIDSQFVVQENLGGGEFAPTTGELRASCGKLLAFLPKNVNSEICELTDEQLLSLDEKLKVYSAELNSLKVTIPARDLREIRQRAYEHIIQILPMEREKLYALLEFLYLDELRKPASTESCKDAITTVCLKIQQAMEERNFLPVAGKKYDPKGETSRRNSKLIQNKGAKIISMIPEDVQNELYNLNPLQLLNLQIRFKILANQVSKIEDDEVENVKTFQDILETTLERLKKPRPYLEIKLEDIPGFVSFLRGNTMAIVRGKIRQVSLYLRKIMTGEARRNLVS